MKKVSFSLLLVAVIMAVALTGCNAKADLEEGTENAKNTVKNAIEFVQLNKDEIPDKIQEIANDCAGKELYFSIKHDGAFYSVLSNENTGKKYVISSVESHTLGISEYVTVNLKEESVAEGENSVTVYKSKEMLDLEGLAFQMATNKAVTDGNTVEKEQVDETGLNSLDNENSKVYEEPAGMKNTPTKITITEPKKDAVIEGGTCMIEGSLDGIVESVTCQLVAEDGTILGEKTSRVSDLSYAFNAKFNYTLAQAETRNADGTVSGYAKVTYKKADGTVALEDSIPVKVK